MNLPIKKRLSTLIDKINVIYTNQIDLEIEGLAYDSRAVENGFLFIALPGLHVDGHNFIEKAISLGASAILYSKTLPEKMLSKHKKIAFVQTDNTRIAMANVSASFYNKPANKLTTIGVTGTDGKTSTVYFIDQLLERLDKKSGFISTAACKTNRIIEKNPYRQSTPEAIDINMMLAKMVDAGKSHAVVEATSHGLSEKNNRLGFMSFNAGIFTNLSHEHLEFHGSFEQYRSDKINLFRKLKSDGFGIVNLDDANSNFFINSTNNRVYTCSLCDPAADFFIYDIEPFSTGSSFTIRISSNALDKDYTIKTKLNLPGLFNIENALEAFACVAILTKANPKTIASFITELSGVRGRMKVIDKRQPFSLIVDYAHTPGSFLRLFPDMRKQTAGNLIAVFGSAGERDKEKRAEQGEIAANYADTLILTDEDPRGEAGIDIIKEIAKGALTAKRGNLGKLIESENLFFIPDRHSAIKKAVSIAEKNDTVLLLGKGHEGTIIYKDGSIIWDEQKAAEDALKEIGYN